MPLCRKHAHLQDRVGEISQRTEKAFLDLLSRHSSKAADDTGQTHVQVPAALNKPQAEFCVCTDRPTSISRNNGGL